MIYPISEECEYLLKPLNKWNFSKEEKKIVIKTMVAVSKSKKVKSNREFTFTTVRQGERELNKLRIEMRKDVNEIYQCLNEIFVIKRRLQQL